MATFDQLFWHLEKFHGVVVYAAIAFQSTSFFGLSSFFGNHKNAFILGFEANCQSVEQYHPSHVHEAVFDKKEKT
jgi:hypothetical protein